jgi:hypothetical protein
LPSKPTLRRTKKPKRESLDRKHGADLSKISKLRTKADLSIDIPTIGGRYVVDVNDMIAPKVRCSPALSEDDVWDAYRALCAEAENVLAGDAGALYSLADKGYQIFAEIFCQEAAREMICNAINGWGGGDPLQFLVHSERFAMPWAFLYVEKPKRAAVDVTKFLGHSSVFVSDITDPGEAKIWPPYEMGQLKVMAGYCDLLAFPERLEIPFLQGIVRRGGDDATIDYIPKLEMRDDRGTPHADKTARHYLFKKGSTVVHFACHGSNQTRDDGNYLRIREGYRLTHTALFEERSRFSRWPLVFLNACEMGFVDPKRMISFARFFMNRGARAVLAPSCKVEDERSAHFSNYFYAAFERGQSVMQSLFSARKKMQRDHGGDLVGFAYALYGQQHAFWR